MIHAAPVRYRSRLGDTTTTIVGTSAQVAGTALSTVAAASSAGLITLGSTLAASIPIAGAVVAIGLLAYSLFHNSKGLQQDADTTAAVNKAETLMTQNLAAWNASSKSYANQTAALANFDQTWAAVVNFCGQASEGSPGQRCISERQRGGKYDYFAAYRDPIANDPLAGAVDRAAAEQAAMAAAATADPVGSALGLPASTGIGWTQYAIPAALLAAALVMK